jgi:OmcA/MtrC family decaheme c-type cytochrome
MANDDHSTASLETAAATGLTDNKDGTYTYQFTRVVTAGAAGAGTVYEPSKIHRLVVLLYAAGNPFTPVNLVKEFVPATGSDVTGQNDKVDGAACLECHTQFRAIAGQTGELGSGEFHGGVRYDVRTCAACHNDQRRFAVSGNPIDSPAVASDKSWTGNMQILNGEAVLNFPVFIHKIHMGEELKMKGLKDPPVANDPGSTYAGFPRPYEVTYPQDVRNCVKCHRAPAPLADNWKNAPSKRACAACHDDTVFVNPVPNGRKLHATSTAIPNGIEVTQDGTCNSCHANTVAPDIATAHIPVSPPNPDNIYEKPTTGSSNTNAAYVAAAGSIPPGAKAVAYDVKSVSTWDDAGTKRPQIVFKIKVGTPGSLTDVVFPDPASATEIIPANLGAFVGSPSAFFAFAVPQDNKQTPADFNVTASSYIRSVWNHTSTCPDILSGPDSSGYYTLQAKCVVVPTGTGRAVMLTGGIGYTYSLGTGPNFTNNNLPLTQTDLPAYKYESNAPAQGGKGGLIVPAPDVWKVADGYTARRKIVANEKCAACHVTLGVGPDFHAGQRNDATSCNFCHNPNRTSNGWSANQKDFVHSIHGAEKRTVKFTWHEKSATEGYWQTTYPAVLNRCEMCHLAGTYDFSTAAMTAALPNMLPSTVGQGTYTSSPANSPNITVGNPYGVGFSFDAATGVSTQPASSTLINSPIVAACSACHDSPAAIDHMQTNGGSFWESRTDAANKKQGEQCLICHGPNRVASISLVHQDRTP